MASPANSFPTYVPLLVTARVFRIRMLSAVILITHHHCVAFVRSPFLLQSRTAKVCYGSLCAPMAFPPVPVAVAPIPYTPIHTAATSRDIEAARRNRITAVEADRHRARNQEEKDLVLVAQDTV